MCNGSAPHTVDHGALITYTCHFKYRGKRVEPIVWEGRGVNVDNVHHNVNQSAQELYRDCHEGKRRLVYNIVLSVTCQYSK